MIREEGKRTKGIEEERKKPWEKAKPPDKAKGRAHQRWEKVLLQKRNR